MLLAVVKLLCRKKQRKPGGNTSCLTNFIQNTKVDQKCGVILIDVKNGIMGMGGTSGPYYKKTAEEKVRRKQIA